MFARYLHLLAAALLLLVVTSCERAKSSNPLSPNLAGPLPWVTISTPKTLDPPAGSDVAFDKQPLTLTIENASSNGPRPLWYLIEIALDAGFTNKVVTRDQVQPGANGRTSVTLASALQTERTYYWRVRAEDGANTSAFSTGVFFKVFTPIVIKEPLPRSPIGGIRVETVRPRFIVGNAATSGTKGPISYQFQVAANAAFASPVAVITVPQQSNETTFNLSQDLERDRMYYWRAKAQEGEVAGPWSVTETFMTPIPPPAPPPPPPGPPPGPGPPPPGPGGYPNNGPAVAAYVEARYPSYLAAGVSHNQRVANMEFLRDRMIEVAICGGLDAAWNLKRGVGPRSSDALAWRTGGKVEVVDIGSAFDDTSQRLRLQWVIVAGPSGYDPYPRPSCP